MRQYFGAIVSKPRFKIYAVIMIICSIVIIINSVLTLQVSTAVESDYKGVRILYLKVDSEYKVVRDIV